jgi:single-stranded-DNA-specific exonuclease
LQRCTWILPQADAPLESDAGTLHRELGLPLPVARLLCRRGYRDLESVRQLLHPSFEQLLDPLLMMDMDRASERLARAVREREHIVINGDYDTDGITGTALLVSELRRLGARVDFFIPDRERDGYGVTPRLVERAGEVGVKVLISVDCGSSDHDALEKARALGIDAIVVDHHEIPQRPDAAWAVLNPKRSDCAYPFKSLSAVGVAYKLLQAVCARLQRNATPEDGLDLVILGTLADVQPVIDENRVMAALGLARLRSDSLRPGVRALLATAGVRAGDVRSGHIGFRMAPRLNAVGRVARGKLGVDLLLAADTRVAGELASRVEGQNTLRKQIQEQMVTEARESAAQLWSEAPRPALVLASESWHHGVVGIVAARLCDEYGVPSVLIAIHNGLGRGSIRTAGNVDVRAALQETSELLLKFGGHREACGLTIEPEKIPAFRQRFEVAVGRQLDEAVPPTLHVDAALQPIEVEPELVDALDRLEPFGTGNPEPLFLLEGARVGQRSRIVGAGHLKLDLEMQDGRTLDAIAFGWGRDVNPADVIGNRLDALGYVRRQDPRWGGGCQLVVADLRPHGTPVGESP